MVFREIPCNTNKFAWFRLPFTPVLVTVKNTIDPANYIFFSLPISLMENFLPEGEKDT